MGLDIVHRFGWDPPSRRGPLPLPLTATMQSIAPPPKPKHPFKNKEFDSKNQPTGTNVNQLIFTHRRSESQNSINFSNIFSGKCIFD